MKKVKCLKRYYEWVASEIKPTVIEHNGFTIIQATDNHIQVYQEGRLIYHASCDKKMSEEELKNQLAFIETIRNKSSSS